MAKKMLKKSEPKIRERLGLTKMNKEYFPCSFRLRADDRMNLKKIVKEMDQHCQSKKISLTDAIRALIQHGLSADRVLLVKHLSRIL